MLKKKVIFFFNFEDGKEKNQTKPKQNLRQNFNG